MSPTLWLALFLLILLLGAAFIWITNKAESINTSVPARPETGDMGYGLERWERELSLWRGVLRRLEIQAKYQSPISERLQQEIDEAKAKIAEAEQNLHQV